MQIAHWLHVMNNIVNNHTIQVSSENSVATESSESSSTTESSSSEDEIDDLIELGTKTEFKPTKWKFPDTKICPFKECGRAWSSTKVAIAHFRNNHAATTMPCLVCNRIYLATSTARLLTHYEIRHPDDTPPELKSVKKFWILVIERCFFYIQTVYLGQTGKKWNGQFRL